MRTTTATVATASTNQTVLNQQDTNSLLPRIFSDVILVSEYQLRLLGQGNMQNFLKISDAVALAFHTLWLLAGHEDELLSTPHIARELKVSEHHLQKVHQRLTKAGFVQAVRGPRGGFRLSMPKNEISLLAVFEAIEGPFDPNRCMLGNPKCQVKNCILGNLVDSVNSLVHDHFEKYTIAQLAETDLVKS